MSYLSYLGEATGYHANNMLDEALKTNRAARSLLAIGRIYGECENESKIKTAKVLSVLINLVRNNEKYSTDKGLPGKAITELSLCYIDAISQGVERLREADRYEYEAELLKNLAKAIQGNITVSLVTLDSEHFDNRKTRKHRYSRTEYIVALLKAIACLLYGRSALEQVDRE